MIASTSFPKARIGALLAVVATALLAGCVDKNAVTASFPPDDYRQRHPILVEETLETLDLPVVPDTRLSTRMKGNVEAFAQKYRASGSKTVAVVAPYGSENEKTAWHMARQAGRALARAGISKDDILFRSYDAAGEASPPVRLAFARVGAHVEPCGKWPDEFPRKGLNGSYYNFGCATQQNFAAAVANPLDLLYPRAMTPPDAARRQSVLSGGDEDAGGYQNGGYTGTDYTDAPGGAVADVPEDR